MKVASPLLLRVVIGCVLIAISVPSCGERKNQTSWWTGEQKQMELSHQLELQKFRYNEIYTGGLTELTDLQTQSLAASTRMESMRREREELTQLVDSQQRKLTEFRVSTLRSHRQRAMGQTFEALRSATGRSFKNVTVSVIDDSGVTIRHADGSTRLRFADLDAKQQHFFGLEADLAQVAHEKEAREAVAYERWIDNQMEISRLSAAAVASVRPSTETASISRKSESPTRQIVASNTSPLSKPARSFGSGSYRSYRFSNDRSCRPTYQTNYYDSPSCSSSASAGCTSYPSQHRQVEYFPHPAGRIQKRSFANTTIPPEP
jgi:hypothetical protein